MKPSAWTVGAIWRVVLLMTVATFGQHCSSEAEFHGANADTQRRSSSDIVVVDETGAVKESEEPVVEEPSVEEPAVEEPAVEEPVVPVDPVEPTPTLPPQTMTLEVETQFAASEQLRRQLTFQPQFQLLMQDVTLQEGAPVTTTFTQPERLSGSVAKQQGKEAESFTETHMISEAGLLDVLVVLDDSTSMATEHDLISTRLLQIVSSVENTNWQIGIITTSDPCLRDDKVVGVNSPDPAAELATIINGIVLDPNVIEYGFPMAIKALKGECNGETKPWIRDNSAIAVLIVSDEDNCGSHSGEGCPGMQGETPEQMVEFLGGLRGQGKAKIYGLIEGDPNTCSNAYYASKYRAAINATNGTWGSICGNAASYTSTLNAISMDVSRLITREFKLAFSPDPGTFKIYVDEVELESGYSLQGDRLILDTATPEQVKLVASYSHSGIPKFDRLSVPDDLSPETLAVYVNGAPLASTSFTYDEMTDEIFFNDMPPDLAMVVATFRRGAALPSSFSLAAADLLGEPIKVEINGSPTRDYTFDGTSVRFASAPSDGQRISVMHKTKGGRVTEYALSDANAADAMTVNASDLDSGDPIEVMLAGDKVVFSADEVTAGRRARVYFELGYAPADLKFALSDRFIESSLQVMADTMPTDCSDLFDIVGSVVEVLCQSDDLGKIKINYDYYSDLVNAFTVSGDFDLVQAIDWQVWIDGVATTNFVAEGLTVKVALEELADLAKVRIKASQTRVLQP